MRVLALQNTQLIIVFLHILGNILVFAEENVNSILFQECGEGSFVDSIGNYCVLCKCSLEGTVLNTNGFPICDKQTGECECKENVEGESCDKCADNYWNFYHGCKPCNCDTVGSDDCSCDVISGQCNCKLGFSGQQCHKNPFSQFDKEERLNCNTCGCNKLGSKSMKCNEEGVCDCLNNFQGNKCDRCSFNRYNASQGCLECGACYNLVQDGLHNVTLKLDDLKKTLQNSNASVAEKPISEFLLKFKAVKVRVDDIHYVIENYTKNDINSIELDFSDLYEKLIGYKQSENDSKTIEALNTSMGSAEDMLKIFENITQVAEVQIQNIKQSLEDATNKTTLLLKPMYNETTSNLEQIGDIARAAQNISKQMEEMDFPNLKTEALKHYELANKTFDVVQLHKTLEEKNITKISDILNSTGIYIEKISKETKEALDLASKALEEAKILAAEIEKFKIASENILNTTKLNGTDIEEMDTSPGDELENIKFKIEKFVHDSSRIGELLGEVMEFGNEFIRVGERDSLGRDNLTALLVKAKQSLVLGQNAIENIETILLDGNNLLQNLTDFPIHFANLSTEASLAREKIPEIEKKVNMVELNVTKTEAVIKEALDASTSIKSNAKEILDSIPQLNRTITNLTLQLTILNNTSEELNENMTTNTNIIGKLETLQKQITESDNTFKEVEMNSTEIYETQKNNYDYLAELAKERAMIESELNEALREQRELLDKYKQDVSLLEAEVLNMKLVQEALPDGCFKRTKLEPKA